MPDALYVQDPAGTTALLSERSEDGTHVLLKTEDGRAAWIDARLIEDDRLTVPFPDALQVVEERIAVGRRVEETGVVTVRKTVEEILETVRMDTVRETVSVERTPVGRFVDEAPETRQEGDVTIVPVLEEVVVVERRLRLREEVRITRNRETVPFEETVSRRREHVEVEREAANP